MDLILKNNIVEPMLSQDYLLEKKFQLMVEQITKKMRSEIESLNVKVGKLQEEVFDLKGKLQRIEAVQIVQPVQAAPVTAPQQPSQEPPKRAEMPGRPDPKDYNEGEITIEKYFSFGKKR
ncbi:hypothetical protein HY638_04005 [Candidatus Woesearchaeota archaeon]|nr:hypothetical protein [Candidatus Woesearchaeota archaeon]